MYTIRTPESPGWTNGTAQARRVVGFKRSQARPPRDAQVAFPSGCSGARPANWERAAHARECPEYWRSGFAVTRCITRSAPSANAPVGGRNGLGTELPHAFPWRVRGAQQKRWNVGPSPLCEGANGRTPASAGAAERHGYAEGLISLNGQCRGQTSPSIMPGPARSCVNLGKCGWIAPTHTRRLFAQVAPPSPLIVRRA
jgi:hypothetical protein